jgi:uncharacterized membrane protein YraQ (UPF0718 family)
MTLLIISVATLGAAPFLHRFLAGRGAWFAGLDAFLLVTVAGLVAGHIMPEVIGAIGWLGVGLMVVGFFGPGLAEHRLSAWAASAHRAALWSALAGLVLHAALDGVALGLAGADASGQSSDALAAAVVLHRLPEGLVIWWLFVPGRNLMAWVSLALVGVGTIAGFVLCEVAGDLLNDGLIAGTQALLAGALLHVLVHRIQPQGAHAVGGRWPPAVGLALGAASLWAMEAVLRVGALPHSHSDSHNHSDAHAGGVQEALSAGDRMFDLALVSAPALLLAYLGAGLLVVFLPAASVRWLRRGGTLGQSLKGVLFGLPLPVCSCGVIPLYRSLVGRGAPLSAGIAFLVATPELGIDAVLLSLPLLGPEMTVIRVVAAALVALFVALLVGGLWRGKETPIDDPPEAAAESGAERLRTVFRVGFGEVLDETGPWILTGIALAAVLAPGLDSAWLATVPGSAQVLLFAAIGVPVYVCAAGATPLVAMFITAGVSPGAALAFLLTGPATNVTTFGVLSQLHGRKVAIAFAAAMIASTVAAGLVVNVFWPSLSVPSLHGHTHGAQWTLEWVALVLLGLAFAASLWRQGLRGMLGQVLAQASDHHHGDHDHDHDPEKAHSHTGDLGGCCD